MTDKEIQNAKADIEATDNLLERALKLSGLITTLFSEKGFALVIVGGSAVEFYTEGGYMSGDIDFCRKSAKAIPLRIMQEIIARLDGKGVARSWIVCGLYIDLLGLLESETKKKNRELDTPYGRISIVPPELTLVERVLFAYCPPTDSCLPAAKQMMVAALADAQFDWAEAERLAASDEFNILAEFSALKREMANELAK